LERWGYLRVFLDPDIFKSVGFIVEGTERLGTVFFVRVPLSEGNSLFGEDYYAITANHVLTPDSFLRLPLKGQQGWKDEPFLLADWIRYRERDIAILPLTLSLSDYDIKPIPMRELIADRDYILAGGKPPVETEPAFHWGTGEEVYTVGLFDQDIGPKLERPIARFGHVALRPAEGELLSIEIDEDEVVEAEAFLVEMASWPGQSGSPIFLRPWVDETRGLENRPHWEFNFLIGMVQGFYPGGEQDVKIQSVDLRLSGLNMGISVAIPSWGIHSALMDQELKNRRAGLLIEQSRTRAKGPKLL
jgi:hypothetical protein